MINRVLKNLIDNISKIPSLSRRNSENIALFLLSNRECSRAIADSLNESLDKVKKCKLCNNFSLKDICKICENPSRDNIICVVQDVKNLVKIEKSNSYNGRYHIIAITSIS